MGDVHEGKFKQKEQWFFDRWRNDDVIRWVAESFSTELERSAAWAMFAHLCNEYPGVRELVRGKLVESVEV